MDFKVERDKAKQDRKNKLKLLSLGDRLRNKIDEDPEVLAKMNIYASKNTDKFVRKMRRGDLTGILAPTGVGKCLAKGTKYFLT